MRAELRCTAVLMLALLGCQEPDRRTQIDQSGKTEAEKTDVSLTEELAGRLIRLSLDCVDREYPNKPGHVLDRADQARPHREFTPAFFGCFDWHSAVHGHWSMVRALRLFPRAPFAAEIEAKLDAHLRPELIEMEAAFFREERSNTFERPYGMGWLLRLRAELELLRHPRAQAWREALGPLVAELSQKLADYLERLTVPVRDGTHQNTAFVLIHALDYVRLAGDVRLSSVIERRARDFFLKDRQCPAGYEPSGEDFISPCLTEADLMRRVLEAGEFRRWLAGFLPSPTDPRFAPLLEPVEVKDPRDPRIGHLIGLAWERAAMFDGIASALDDGHRWKENFRALARRHRREALRQMFDAGYGGEHWLASVALYALAPATESR